MAGGATYFVDIYSNDGTSLIYSDETSITNFSVTDTGLEQAYGLDYTYAGAGTFLGFATVANATEPTYAVGDTFNSYEDLTLYIVEGVSGIQAQINRISGAKTDLATWLTDNGVTVPEGTLLDGLVELLAGVQAGGDSGGASEWKIATGTFISNANIDTSFTIQHDLGVIPQIVLVQLLDRQNGINKSAFVTVIFASIDITNAACQVSYASHTFTPYLETRNESNFDRGMGNNDGYLITSTEEGPTESNNYQVVRAANASTLIVNPKTKSSEVYFCRGRTYRWIVMGK